MRSEGGKQAFVDGLVALVLAVAVHLFFAGLLVVSAWDWPRFDRPEPPVRVTLVERGPMVDARRADDEAAALAAREADERQRLEAAERAAAEQERQRQIERRERELAEQEAERQRALELQRQRAEQRQRIAEERQRAEAERDRELAELRERREQARREREQQERRLAELANRRAAAEQARREQEEAERLRLADARARAEARRATLREEYVSTIRELVRRSWIRPPTTAPGVECRVRVVQIPGGEIIAAEIIRPCNADAATRRSITAAVLRVGTLPYRGYEDVFAREIDFFFRYNG
ncbi:MAG: protein TolA [Gammaproteobacteria bacterium]|jgi:colicin import membrane protein|nr:protein TolA [Gammaproteobacteria bacterium]